MERRNRSVEALDKLLYLDSLETQDRADQLVSWVEQYLSITPIEEFDLKKDDLEKLSELFYKNINFLKQHRQEIKSQIDSHHKIKQFLQ